MNAYTNDRITAQDRRALRRMYVHVAHLLETVEDGDVETYREITELVGVLASAVPFLLNEIERLLAERVDGERPRMVKFDAMSGGRA